MNETSTPDAPLVTFLKGMAMGTADIIPGVSGGTMAFILGIYERLLTVIRAANMAAVRELCSGRIMVLWRRFQPLFAVPLLLGIVAAVVVMTKVVQLPSLLHTHPELVYGLFFGLIAGSIVVLLRDYIERLHARDGLVVLGGVALGLFIVTLTPTQTPEAPWFYFLCGALAISAMLMPGVSGSFILLILGKYAAVLQAIAGLDWGVLAPFMLGCAVGLLSFARLVGYLLSRFHRQTILVICGVLIGTLYAIWPFQARDYELIRGKERLVSSAPVWPDALSTDTVLAVGLMALGAGAVWALAAAARRKELVPLD